MDAAEGDDVRAQAERLLERRQNPKWVSLSWVALRPLISSLNQVLCEAAPALIPHLRGYWLTRVPATSDDVALSRHVDRRGDRAFVVIGDTGEQDRSQYIVSPVLRRVVAQEGAGFAVICSDVIYPSGDVNDYVHGVYLPYGPDPQAPQHPTALERLPLLAIPGNHDWHDGLSGFMQHFCGTGPLPREEVGWPAEVTDAAARRRDGLIRLLWRRPVAARPQRLWRRIGGDDPVLADGLTAWTPRTVEQQRRLRRPDGPVAQPGPYLTIGVDGLLVVAIDVGIGLGEGDSEIDAEQGRWLVAVSRLPGPKVLLTGNPLLVNAQWKVCWIGGPGGEPVDGYRTVNEVVADARFGYVAAIGGDVHNFQHSAQTVGEPGAEHLVHYVVSGGGGAYMSATHPVEVVSRRAAASAEAAPDQDPDAIREANRRTGGAAVGRSDGSPAARLVDGDVRLVPAPAESLAHYARLMLPKVWRLERALLAALAGIGAGHVLHLLDGAGTGRDLGAGAALLVALLVLRALVNKPLTRRLFRSRDVEHDPVNRAYRAAVTAAAGLAGGDVALAGAWTAGTSWTRHLVAWAALTLGACGVAAVMRYTGWWREPVPRDGADAPRRARVALAVWALGVAVAAALGMLLPTWGRRVVPPGVLAGVGVLALVAAWRWRPRTPTVGHAWGRLAPLGSYVVQAVAAVAILTWSVFGRVWWLPAATVLGVVAFAVVLLVAFGAAAVVLRVAAGLGSAGSRGWERAWGRVGGWGPWLTGAIATAVLGGQLALALGPWSSSGAAADAYRRMLSTELALGALLTVLLLVDTLRRRTSGLWFTAAAVLVSLAPAGVAAVLDARTAWSARVTLVPIVGAALLLLTVVLAHLVFLGAQYLVLDRGAHRDGPDLLDEAAAAAFLGWRSTEDGPAPLPPVPLRRARIVFPTTGSPRGPIQQKVSEIFDSDVPPFWKNFLLLRVLDSVQGRQLRIDVHVVHGTGGVEAESVPQPPPILVDLPS